MTLIVCPNLAIDRVIALTSLQPGTTLRARLLAQQAGGKGANVLRALRTLGGNGLLAGFVAGASGRLIAELAAADGLATELIASAGETRVSTVVLSDSGPATRFFEYGPEIGATEEQALSVAITRHTASSAEWAVVNGAAQPGSSDGFYGALCRSLRAAGYRVMVDATGAQLTGALRERPDFVKVNRVEAATALEDLRPGQTPAAEAARESGLAAEALALCERLVRAGAQGAVVTFGAAGAAGLIGGRFWLVATPPVTVINTTGSGDCFAAALLLGLERSDPLEQTLATAAGVGAANAADAVTGRFDPSLARELAGRAYVGPPGQHIP
jgi:1-phosphofructokinase family hexose kinase